MQVVGDRKRLARARGYPIEINGATNLEGEEGIAARSGVDSFDQWMRESRIEPPPKHPSHGGRVDRAEGESLEAGQRRGEGGAQARRNPQRGDNRHPLIDEATECERKGVGR